MMKDSEAVSTVSRSTRQCQRDLSLGSGTDESVPYDPDGHIGVQLPPLLECRKEQGITRREETIESGYPP